MKQSACPDSQDSPPAAAAPGHVAIIMDGNGRWATRRGKPRRSGHRAGAAAVRRTVEAAPTLGIGTLTLYAFSSDNWKRPADEVSSLMRLLLAYLRTETAECVEQGVRVTVIGRRDRLPSVLQRAIADAEAATSGGNRLHLRLALDYSARDAIVRAATKAATKACAQARGSAVQEPLTRDEFVGLLAAAQHERTAAADVDLLIRTGGEQRLSDFLLWECAYAELYFTAKLWPDFDGEALALAVAEFGRRWRRFGGVEAVRGSALSATS
jgi:undecaprenyl diphosphate synthase